MRLNIFNSIFGLCVASVAVSCSNDQVIDGPRPNGGNDSDMISFMVADDYTRGGSFGNRPGSSTRSSVTTTDNIADYPFAVYGDMTLESSTDRVVLFNGVAVKHDNSDNQWKYDDIRYWIPNREFSFVAIYPKNITGLSNISYENNRLAFTYTLSEEYSKATDILTAGHRRQYNSTSAAKPVELSFGHILSRINFVATVDAGIDIKKITVRNLVSEGSYSVEPAAIISGSETSDLTLNDPVWTLTSKTIDVSKSTNSSNINKEDNSIVLFPANDPLFVFPQSTDEQVVEVIYTKNGSEQTIVGNLNATSIALWVAGKSYTYSFTISDSDYIVFDKAELKDWEEADGSSYIIIN